MLQHGLWFVLYFDLSLFIDRCPHSELLHILSGKQMVTVVVGGGL